MTRVMLNNKKLPTKLLAKAINTTCRTINCVYVRPGMEKPNFNYFYVFGSKCYILNDREHLSKFDSKSDEGVFFRLF